jgi:hypothetical protein
MRLLLSAHVERAVARALSEARRDDDRGVAGEIKKSLASSGLEAP